MLQKVLKIFEKFYSKYGEDFIIENSSLQKCHYVLVDIKRGDTIKISDEIYEYTKKFDYYSKIISTNKTLELPARKILSNQFCSFYIKKNNIKKNFITKAILEKYRKNTIKNYNSLEKDYKLEIEKEICRYIKRYFFKYTVEKETIDDIFYWIEDNLKEVIENSKYERIKIFFVIENLEYTLNLFRQEYYKYIIWNLQNKNEKNLEFLERDIFNYTFNRFLLTELGKKKNYIYFAEDDSFKKLYKLKISYATDFNSKIDEIIELKKAGN